MLVLSRRQNEKILFPKLGIIIEIRDIARNVVRVGIQAPSSVGVVRAEIASEADKASAANTSALRHRIRNRLNTAHLAVHLAQKQFQAGRASDGRETLNEALRQYAELDQELTAEQHRSKNARRQLRALLVEDNSNESALLAELLRLHGIDVETVGDGQDALDFLRYHDRPDVILLDMRLPRCDGPTTLAAIRANNEYNGTKVFAVSGGSPQEFNLPPGSRGVDRWFTKPINPMKLIDEMNSAIARN